jgi:hypothetical protein
MNLFRDVSQLEKRIPLEVMPLIFIVSANKPAIPKQTLICLVNLKLPTEVLQETDRECHVHYVPLGVVACILPWNCTFYYLPRRFTNTENFLLDSPIWTSHAQMSPGALSRKCLHTQTLPVHPILCFETR